MRGSMRFVRWTSGQLQKPAPLNGRGYEGVESQVCFRKRLNPGWRWRRRTRVTEAATKP